VEYCDMLLATRAFEIAAAKPEKLYATSLFARLIGADCLF
jgi:hypothetical protein